MQSNFDNRDFEQFVKQNADQYRMFPSEKVWNGIHTALHTRLRWLGYGVTLLLLSSAAITWIMLSNTRKSAENAQSLSGNQLKNFVALQHVPSGTAPAPVNFTGPAAVESNTFSTAQELQQSIVSVIPAENMNTDERMQPIVNANTIGSEKPVIAVAESKNIIPSAFSIIDQATDNNYTPGLDAVNKFIAGSNAVRHDVNPMSIESIVNSYVQKPVKLRKFSWQVYFTPTISYRKLTENKAYLSSLQGSNGYSSSMLYDVNSVVTHKPDMGLELGFNAGYHLSRNLTITAGLQFNVSKYDIKAYSYSSEVATIALNTAYGTSSVSAPTNYRNFDGYKQNWLANLYYSVSAPIGAELKLTGDRKTYWGIGGTIQPTYILGDRAYLISTDYKNYAEVPSLMRKWNVNSSIETFAGYSTGKIQWRVGPQVRYQMLSSFKEKYPVKEHLFDFGLKVGIMLNQ